MSTRVRLFATHPRYGVNYGPFVKKYVHETFKAKFGNMDPIQYAPLYATWPTWKRIMWMAKFEGHWQIYAFREPRHTDIRKSLYGKMFQKNHVNYPELVKGKKPKKQEKAVAPQPGAVIVRNGDDIWRHAAVDNQWYVAGNQLAQVPPPNPQQIQQQAALVPGQAQAVANDYLVRQVANVEEARERARQRRRPMFHYADEDFNGI